MFKLKKKIAVLICVAMALASLSGVTVSAELIRYNSFLFDTDTGYIEGYLSNNGGNLVIPSVINGCEVIGLGDEAFAEEGSGSHRIYSVVFPETLKVIGEKAFSMSAFITDLNLPGGLKRIGAKAFLACERLQRVIIPDSVTELGVSAFETCTHLNYVKVGNGVTSIPDNAFSGMGYGAWAELYLTENVTSISENAFDKDWCHKITIFAPKGSYAIDYAGSHGIPFKYYPEADDNTTTEVSRGTCGDNLSWALDSEGTLTISGTGDMDNWVESPWYSSRASITSAVIGSGVTSIGVNAFDCCSNLKSVTIPGSVTNIWNCAFYKCSSLKSVTIPDSVTSIENGTFGKCSSLRSVTIPDSVTRIDYNAFSGCDRLTDVYYSGSEAEWNKINIKVWSDPGNEPLYNATVHFNSTDEEPRWVENDNEPSWPNTKSIYYIPTAAN